MRWLILCLMVPLSAAAASSVLLVPKGAASRAVAEELIDVFSAQQVRVKLAGDRSPAEQCLSAGARGRCLRGLEHQAKADGVVVLEAVTSGKQVKASFELLVEGAVVRKDTVSAPTGKLAAKAEPVVQQLMQAMKRANRPTVAKAPPAPEPPPERLPEGSVVAPPVLKPVVESQPVAPPPSDAPTATVLRPEASAPDVLRVSEVAPPAPKVKVGALTATGVAVAAAVAAVAFGILGADSQSRLGNAPNGLSPLTYTEATALRDQSNTQFTVSVGAGIGAGVAATVAAILWGVE